MTSAKSAVLAVLLAWGATGCVASAGAEAPAGDPPPAPESGPFMEPAVLTVSAEGSQAELDQMTMPIVSGVVGLSATGPDEVSLDSLQVDVGEVALPHANLAGMKLEDIRVRLEKPSVAPVQISDSGTRFTTIETTLVVDWKLVTQLGDTVPLATQRFEGVKLDLGIYQSSEGKTVADPYGGKEGSLGEWAGLGEMDDLLFDIHAVE